MKLTALLWLVLAVPQEPAISLETDPQGATVTVKGLEGVWTTPCRIPLGALKGGPAELMIAKEGFETILRRENVKASGLLKIAFQLTPRAKAEIEEPLPPKVAEAIPPKPIRLRVTGTEGAVRVLADGKVVAEGPVKPGEPVELAVPPGKIRVEHLNAPGGSAARAVEILPDAPAIRKQPGRRIGQVRLVHRVYGVFVKLDPGPALVPGEGVALFRDGREVARSRVLQVVGGDETYPDGAAQLARSGLTIRKGDEARRLK